eukprot:3669268-Amphidinium_carterae.2
MTTAAARPVRARKPWAVVQGALLLTLIRLQVQVYSASEWNMQRSPALVAHAANKCTTQWLSQHCAAICAVALWRQPGGNLSMAPQSGRWWHGVPSYVCMSGLGAHANASAQWPNSSLGGEASIHTQAAPRRFDLFVPQSWANAGIVFLPLWAERKCVGLATLVG